MMAQPDFEKISASFTALARELVLLPNARLAVNNQVPIDTINELRNEIRQTAAETNRQISETNRQIAELYGRIETLRTDVFTRLGASIERLRTDMTTRMDAR